MEWYYVWWPGLSLNASRGFVSISWGSCFIIRVIDAWNSLPIYLINCHTIELLQCALAAAQCIVIGPVCGFVCGSVTMITGNCSHRSSPNWVFRLDAWALSVIATATRLAGWVAGWVSVTLRYCIKTAKPIRKLFRPSESRIILVFWDPCADTKFQGEPHQRGR